MYRDPHVAHVFDVVEHGRRFYRSLVFSSDPGRCLHEARTRAFLIGKELAKARLFFTFLCKGCIGAIAGRGPCRPRGRRVGRCFGRCFRGWFGCCVGCLCLWLFVYVVTTPRGRQLLSRCLLLLRGARGFYYLSCVR